MRCEQWCVGAAGSSGAEVERKGALRHVSALCDLLCVEIKNGGKELGRMSAGCEMALETGLLACTNPQTNLTLEAAGTVLL